MNTVEISCRIVHETTSAYLIDGGIDENVWIPKSQVTEVADPDSKGLVKMTMSEWIAGEKNLI